MKVSTLWWGMVDARYERDKEGREWLRTDAGPWGYLLARDLSSTAEWETALQRGCEEAARVRRGAR